MVLPAPNGAPGPQHRARFDAAHPRLPGCAAAADDAKGGLRAGERGWCQGRRGWNRHMNLIYHYEYDVS